MMVFVLLSLSLLAVVTTLLLVSRIRLGEEARSWPQHPASITHSVVSRKATKVGFLYYVHLRFDYVADGPRSGSCTLPSSWGTHREGYAARLASHFHAGAHVVAHVNPKNPKFAILLPGADTREWELFWLMTATAIGAAVCAFLV